MATVYRLKGIAAANAYDSPAGAALTADFNVPELIANPGLLALDSAPNEGLGSFSGFEVGDSVKIALIPKGFLVQNSVVQHKALQATVTVDIGDSAAVDTFTTTAPIVTTSATDTILLPQAGGAKIYNADNYLLVTVTGAKATAVEFTVNLFGGFAQ